MNYHFLVQKTGSKTRNRFFLILGLGLFAYFGSSRAILGGSSLSGSGALAVLVLSFMAGQGWSKEEKVITLGENKLQENGLYRPPDQECTIDA